jgi:hypothetical protein
LQQESTISDWIGRNSKIPFLLARRQEQLRAQEAHSRSAHNRVGQQVHTYLFPAIPLLLVAPKWQAIEQATGSWGPARSLRMLMENFTALSEGGGGPRWVVVLGTGARGPGCGRSRMWWYREGHTMGAHDAAPAVVDWTNPIALGFGREGGQRGGGGGADSSHASRRGRSRWWGGADGAWRWALDAAKDTDGIAGAAASAGREGGRCGQPRSSLG